MKKALVIDGVAVNVVASSDLEQSFHPDVAAKFADVSDEVEEGWRLVGNTWQSPPAAEGPVAPNPVVDVPTFFMLLTADERVAFRASTDAKVKDWLTILDDPRTQAVNLGLPPVKASLNYMTTLTPPLLTTARVAQILTGTFPA
jgi:hypothetical protein